MHLCHICKKIVRAVITGFEGRARRRRKADAVKSNLDHWLRLLRSDHARVQGAIAKRIN